MTIEELQTEIHRWITTVGVRYFSELTNMAVLTEEVGEVARIMARQYGEQKAKPEEAPQELADELADVLWVVAAIANQTGVDLTKALEENMAKKSKRDQQRHKNNEKLSG